MSAAVQWKLFRFLGCEQHVSPSQSAAPYPSTSASTSTTSSTTFVAPTNPTTNQQWIETAKTLCMDSTGYDQIQQLETELQYEVIYALLGSKFRSKSENLGKINSSEDASITNPIEIPREHTPNCTYTYHPTSNSKVSSLFAALSAHATRISSDEGITALFSESGWQGAVHVFQSRLILNSKLNLYNLEGGGNGDAERSTAAEALSSNGNQKERGSGNGSAFADSDHDYSSYLISAISGTSTTPASTKPQAHPPIPRHTWSYRRFQAHTHKLIDIHVCSNQGMFPNCLVTVGLDYASDAYSSSEGHENYGRTSQQGQAKEVIGSLKLWMQQDQATRLIHGGSKSNSLLMGKLPGALPHAFQATKSAKGLDTSEGVPLDISSSSSFVNAVDLVSLTLVCVTTVPLKRGSIPSCLSVSSQERSFAIGCTDGSVFLISGDIRNSQSLSKSVVRCAGIECTKRKRDFYADEDDPTTTRAPTCLCPSCTPSAQAVISVYFTPSHTPKASVASKVAQAVFVVTRASVIVIRFEELVRHMTLEEGRGGLPNIHDPKNALDGFHDRWTVIQTGIRQETLDSRGLPSRKRACLFESSLTVAREEGIFFYTADGFGPCIAFPNDMSTFIFAAEGYLFCVSAVSGTVVYDIDNKLIAYRGMEMKSDRPATAFMALSSTLSPATNTSSTSASPSSFSYASSPMLEPSRQGNQIPDSLNPSASIEDFGVGTCVLWRVPIGVKDPKQAEMYDAEHTTVLLIGRQGSLFVFHERSLATRINFLTERGLYSQAIALAEHEKRKTRNLKSDLVNDMIAKVTSLYAKSLLDKREFDAAAQEYMKILATDHALPSWVILQLIEQPVLRTGLITYLEAMHQAGLGSAYHRKLLVSCYGHRRAYNRSLHQRATEQSHASESSTLDFSQKESFFLSSVACRGLDPTAIDSLIDICREMSLYDSALQIAQDHKREFKVAQILLLDEKDPLRVFDLLSSMESCRTAFDLLTQNCAEIGRQLAKSHRSQLAQTIIGIFVEMEKKRVVPGSVSVDCGKSQFVEYVPGLCALFIDCPYWLSAILQSAIESLYITTVNLTSMSKHIQAKWSNTWQRLLEACMMLDMAEATMCPACYLEASLKSAKERDKCLLCPHDLADNNYIKKTCHHHHRHRSPGELKPGLRYSFRPGIRALRLLQNPRNPMDASISLHFAELYGHAPCLLFLHESMRNYRELGVTLRLLNDADGMKRACRRHGDREPLLWIEAFYLFLGRVIQTNSASETVPSKSSHDDDLKELREIMIAIDRNSILTPMEMINEIISCLKQSQKLDQGSKPALIFQDIRAFFEELIVNQHQQATQIEAEIQGVKETVSRTEKMIQDVNLKPIYVNPQRCNLCDMPLELPFAYFACCHMFHFQCVADLGSRGLARRENFVAPSFGSGLHPEAASQPIGPLHPISSSAAMELLQNRKNTVMRIGDYGSNIILERSVSGALSATERDNKAGVLQGEESHADLECPLCQPENEVSRNFLNAVDSKSQEHDEFYRSLEESSHRLDAMWYSVSRRPLS